MNKKYIVLDNDNIPVTAEKLCLLPDILKSNDIDSVSLRMIDSFPWDFECRMKADFAYSDNTVDYFVNRIAKLGIKLQFVLPGEGDFIRLMKLSGYRRYNTGSGKNIFIDTEAVGFTSLIESIVEDYISLCPAFNGFILDTSLSGETYINKVFNAVKGVYDGNCVKVGISEYTPSYLLVCGDDNAPVRAYDYLKKACNDLSNSSSELKQLLIMSSLASSSPAVTGSRLNYLLEELYNDNIRVNDASDLLLKEASGIIEPGWLELYIKSIRLNAAEELKGIEMRLSQAGLLN